MHAGGAASRHQACVADGSKTAGLSPRSLALAGPELLSAEGLWATLKTVTAGLLSPRVRGSRGVVEASRPMLGSGVYPRVCGGACKLDASLRRRALQGLSPRVRGSLQPAISERSRPASGLSPRVRGSRLRSAAATSSSIDGSIPACAGEPAPRSSFDIGLIDMGLSPRVRGSRGGRRKT